MRRGFWLRSAAAAAGLAALAGCGLLPPSQQQEFTLSGSTPATADAPFRTTDANGNDVMARGYCADGYEKLGEASLPADRDTFEQWRLRCKPHRPSLGLTL